MSTIKSNTLSYPSSLTITAPTHILDLLQRLHRQSLDEEKLLTEQWQTIKAAKDTATYETLVNEIMRDKMIALEADKAAFVYQLLRATGATRVVEAGTSCGVSTIYLALAVGQNAKAKGQRAEGRKDAEIGVVATEWEPKKVARAKEHWRQAGPDVEQWIDLREGDLRERLKEEPLSDRSVDAVLFDIWTPLVAPTLSILEPKLKPGAVLLADNTAKSNAGYEDFFAKVRVPGSPYRSVTLPFSGGFEMVTYCPED